MSKFELTIPIKQHSPMIHFQSEEEGATLRATELKPKLDTFIQNELKIIDRELYDKYKHLITDENYFPSDKGSNSYKISISANKVKTITFKTYVKTRDLSPIMRVGSYFANDLAVENEEVSVTIKSLVAGLIDLVAVALEHVLVYENFGTRQTKGFGSFSLNIDDAKYKTILQKKYGVFYLKRANDPLETIMKDYQHLKSGKRTNNDSEYSQNKSKLFNYMCNQQIRWEKRMIKVKMQQKFGSIYDEMKFEHEPVRCNNSDESYDYQYIRALLGYAETNEYLKTSPINHKDKIYIRISSMDKVGRYKSPITYKIFNNTIYVLPNPSNAIEGKRFNFKIKDTQENLNDTPIVVPSNFDLVDFLDTTLENDFSYRRIAR